MLGTKRHTLMSTYTTTKTLKMLNYSQPLGLIGCATTQALTLVILTKHNNMNSKTTLTKSTVLDTAARKATNKVKIKTQAKTRAKNLYLTEIIGYQTTRYMWPIRLLQKIVFSSKLLKNSTS